MNLSASQNWEFDSFVDGWPSVCAAREDFPPIPSLLAATHTTYGLGLID
jgi:hypothetical protein